MSDTIDINVNKIVETIDVFANFEHPNIEINTIESVDNVEVNATPNVVQININSISGDVEWGEIEGILSNQTDLQNALDLKANASDLGDVAFSNDYNDLDNLPTIPNNLEELHNVTETNYTTPIDTDSVLTFDVNNSLWKRLSWANIKSNLKTYFDTFYLSLSVFDNFAEAVFDSLDGKLDKSTTASSVYGTNTAGGQTMIPLSDFGTVKGTGTNGQVAFFNGTTTQTGDNGLFWDNTNKRLGVGTNAPTQTFYMKNGDAPMFGINTVSGQTEVNIYNQVTYNSALKINAASGVVTWANGSSIQTNSNGLVITNDTANTPLRVAYGPNVPSTIFQVTDNTWETGFFLVKGNGNTLINTTTDNGGKLQIKAQGALSTDIAFRVRNSEGTGDLLRVDGKGILSISSNSGNANSRLNFFGNAANNNYAFIQSRFGLSSNFGRLEFGTKFLSNTLTKMTLDEFGCLILGTSGVIGNESAVLDLVSTTKGFLPPRMTTAQIVAIVNPAAGLIVYDTTENKHYGFNGTTWNAFY